MYVCIYMYECMNYTMYIYRNNTDQNGGRYPILGF